MNKSPYDECAFGNPGKEGGAAAEPFNALRARICALGPVPFGCHHGTDWHGSSNWPASKVRETLRTVGICEGWRAEVRRLNGKGWYGRYRIIRRAVAKQALFVIELFTAAKPGRQKKKYLANLKRMMRFLGTKDIEHKKIPLIDIYP